jgi:outer membrane protein assembly factor BamB
MQLLMRPFINALFLLALIAPASVAAEVTDAPAKEALYVRQYDSAAEVIERLSGLARDGKWADAVAEAQKHIAAGSRHAAQVQPGTYVSFAERIRRLVCAWPKAGVAAYRDRYEKHAAKQLAAALETRNARDLAEVGDLYCATKAAAKALDALADLYLQRGALVDADRTLTRLASLPKPRGLADADLERKLKAARSALARLTDDVQRPPFKLGLRAWSFTVPQADVDRQMAKALTARGHRVPRVARPAIAGRRLLLQTSQWLASFERHTNGIVWRHPRRPEPPDGQNLFDAVMEPRVVGGRVFAFVAGKVVALSASTGDLIWQFGKFVPEVAVVAEGKEKKAAPLASVRVNSLAVAEGKVFVAVAAVKQETEFSVIALDVRSGAELWRTRLCSQVFRGVLGRGSHPAPPVYSQGVVYVSTNLGAVAAVDAADGAIRWLATYNAFNPARRRVALRNDDCWANNAPIVYRGLLLAAPQDSDHLVAFDLRDGARKWQAPRLGMRYLVGADGGLAVLAGPRIATVEVATGRVAFLSKEQWDVVARPAMSASALWLPTQRALIEVDRKTGRPVLEYRCDGPRQAGNLVLADGLMLSASFGRVDAYRDQAAAPDNGPAGMLGRGERLERTGNTARALREYKLALYAIDEEAEVVARVLRPRALGLIAAAQMRLGEELMAAGEFDKAVRALILARTYAQNVSGAVRATFAIAACQERSKKWTEAVHTYQSALERYADEVVAVRDEITMPVRHVARFRIGRIIAAEGRGVYRLFDGRAQKDLVMARENKTPQVVASIIEQYPNSIHADAARKELVKLGAGNDEAARVWFTAYDTSRSTPIVLARASDGAGGDEPVAFIATRDRGSRTGYLWDAVECRRLRDGRVLWRTPVEKTMTQAVRVGQTLVLRGYMHLAALDTRTGEPLWSTKHAPVAPKGPRELGWTVDRKRIIDLAAGGGWAVAATAARELFAVDLKTGKEAWRETLSGGIRVGSLHLAGARVAVCIENPGKVLWFDAATGRASGSYKLKRDDSRLTDAPAHQPKNARLCVVVGDRQVRNIDLKTGKELWSREMSFGVGRVAATPDEERIVIFPDRWSMGGKVHCIEAATGNVLWSEKPKCKDPRFALVRSDLLVSSRREFNSDRITAQKIRNGAVAWERVLRVRPGIDAVVGSGTRLAAYGSRMEFGGWAAQATLLHTVSGAPFVTIRRPGAGLASVAELGETLLLCSNRGIEAYRVQDEWATAGPLLSMLDAKELPKPDEPQFAELARLLLVHGRRRAAMRLLDAALEAEPPKPKSFVALHRQLMAARQADAVATRTVYEAPPFRRAPNIDGRLSEDWRRDRAAVLTRPRDVEEIQIRAPLRRFWNGRNDLSAVLYLGWDEKNLYMAVDVRDFVHQVHDFDADVWKGDCLVVSIDPEGNGGYQLRGSDNVFWLGLAAKQRKKPEDDREQLGGEHRVKIKEDESGVVYELALPWSDLAIQRPRAGLRFRLNIMAIDDDAGGPMKSVSWTPGMTQNRNKTMMSLGIAPELFGTVILKER